MGRTAGNAASGLINAAALGFGSYGLYYTIKYIELPPYLATAGRWQFLTNLSLVISLVVFALGAVAHAVKSTQLFQIKNALHPVALVLELVVTLVYWPLRIVFIRLLVSDPSRKFIPMFVDICLHLVPGVALVIDFFCFMPRLTVNNRDSFGVCMLLTFMYWAWLKRLIDVEGGGQYPYNFLNVDAELTRVIIFVIVGVTGYGAFLLLRRLYDVLVEAEAEEYAGSKKED